MGFEISQIKIGNFWIFFPIPVQGLQNYDDLNYFEGVWRVFGGCLEAVKRVSSGRLNAVRQPS